MGEYSFLLLIALVFSFGTMSPGPSFILVAKLQSQDLFMKELVLLLVYLLGLFFILY